MLHTKTSRRRLLYKGFAGTAASLTIYVMAATLGAAVSLHCARPSNSISELLDVLCKKFFANASEKLELAVFSLVSTALIHQLVRVTLTGLLIRALIFGFFGGFFASMMPAIELYISDESPLRFLRWLGRKPFWVYVGLITCNQLLFELLFLFMDRFFGCALFGFVAKSESSIEQN